MTTVAFLPARAKLWIGSLDRPDLEVRAQYNPKELQIDKQVPWQDHRSNDNRGGTERQEGSEQSDLEFNGVPARSMTVELLFDSYERAGESVEADVRALEEMSSVREPGSSRQELRRPHHCVVAWGDSAMGMRPFRCVIESLIVKYTMWDHGGMPVRATCTVKLKEALRMVGAAAAQDHYSERRRGPGFDRANPSARDSWSEDTYMAETARSLNSPRGREP